ncbi:hypothetical protein [Nocardia wallacei]|uniref:hypothetical protein n=1 Tax=Nocardia wallacei TaxID=480035 RepID=UPI002456269A|nr:hypothetical protein [Nocardia wallacei]
MSCQVKNCSNGAATVRNLDPDKVGGWASFPMEVALCQSHAAAVGAGADWVCHSPEGVSGWEVLVGEQQIKDLNMYVFQSAPTTISSGSASTRDSGVLPHGRKVSINAHQVGSREPSTTIDLFLDPAQAHEMIKLLEFYIEVEEKLS